jgi:hypothetical protein
VLFNLLVVFSSNSINCQRISNPNNVIAVGEVRISSRDCRIWVDSIQTLWI